MRLKKLFFLLSGIAIAAIIIVVVIIVNDSEEISVTTEKPETTISPDQETLAENENVIYELSERERNPKLEAAIINEIGFTSDTDIEATRYYYSHIDLNDDDLMEIFVELVGPYTSGSGGDTGLIYTETDGEYKLLQKFTLITNPIIISNNTTNGWHDIIINLSGGGIPSQLVQLQYDGKKYPNPSDANPIPEGTVIKGIGIIADDIAKDFEEGKGLYLSPQ